MVKLVIDAIYPKESDTHNWHQSSHCQTFFIRNIIKLTSNLLKCVLSQYALIQMGAGAAEESGKRQIKPCNTKGASEVDHFRLLYLLLGMCVCVCVHPGWGWGHAQESYYKELENRTKPLYYLLLWEKSQRESIQSDRQDLSVNSICFPIFDRRDSSNTYPLRTCEVFPPALVHAGMYEVLFSSGPKCSVPTV